MSYTFSLTRTGYCLELVYTIKNEQKQFKRNFSRYGTEFLSTCVCRTSFLLRFPICFFLFFHPLPSLRFTRVHSCLFFIFVVYFNFLVFGRCKTNVEYLTNADFSSHINETLFIREANGKRDFRTDAKKLFFFFGITE